MTTKTPKTPGALFRASVEEAYEFDNAGAEQLLDEICSTMDELAILEQSVRENGALLDGPRGNKVVHPSFAAIARHRALLARLIRDLFPEDDPETQAQKAARAARARWRRKQR